MRLLQGRSANPLNRFFVDIDAPPESKRHRQVPFSYAKERFRRVSDAAGKFAGERVYPDLFVVADVLGYLHFDARVQTRRLVALGSA